MPDTTYRFEDLPLIRDGAFVSARISGIATISFDTTGSWRVETIALDGDNDLCGRDARRQTIPLDSRRDGALWQLVEAALARESFADISELVAADTPYTDPNAEHRLSAAQLGVGLYAGRL